MLAIAGARGPRRRRRAPAGLAGRACASRGSCLCRAAGRAPALRGAGYVGAAYAHYVNRDGDPHLHTHVVIANQTLAEDDPSRWRALDAVPLLIGWRRAARRGLRGTPALRADDALRGRLAVRRGGGYELAAVHQGGDPRHQPPRRRRPRPRRAARRAHRPRAAHRRPGGAPTPAGVRLRRAPRGLARARRGARPRRAVCATRLFGTARQARRGAATIDDPDLLGARGLTATAQTFTHADLVAALADAAPDGARPPRRCGTRRTDRRARRGAVRPRRAPRAPAALHHR